MAGMKEVKNEPGAGHSVDWRAYWGGVGLVVLATLIGLLLAPRTAPVNLVWLYAAAVLATAVLGGAYPALFAAALGVILFELFFVPLTTTLRFAESEFLVPLASLIAAGALLGILAVRAHQRELSARAREAQALALFDASKRLTAISGPLAIAEATVELAATIAGREIALFLPPATGAPLAIAAATPGFESSSTLSAEANQFYAARSLVRMPRGGVSRVGGVAFVPIQGTGAPLGVLGVDTSTAALSREEQSLLLSFTGLAALALERASLAAAARATRLLEETERLQTALLNSISHDLRTPLASITGSLSSLLEDEALLSPPARRELAQNAWEEAMRLNRLVGNLLDMTRLQSGALRIAAQPADVDELVGAALAQMAPRLQGREILRAIPPDLPPVSIDLVFMVQALVNLLDNALKYAPPEQPVEIVAAHEGQTVTLAVRDRGPGLPPGDSEALFNRFTRGSGAAGSGTGLGLSIARGLVEAHDGRLTAANRQGGGATFTIELAVAAEEEGGGRGGPQASTASR